MKRVFKHMVIVAIGLTLPFQVYAEEESTEADNSAKIVEKQSNC